MDNKKCTPFSIFLSFQNSCLNENLEILLSTRRTEILNGGIHAVFRVLKFQTNAVICKIYGFRSGTDSRSQMGNPIRIKSEIICSSPVDFIGIIPCNQSVDKRIAGWAAKVILAKPHTCIHKGHVREKI